jgi:hypothetical protein
MTASSISARARCTEKLGLHIHQEEFPMKILFFPIVLSLAMSQAAMAADPCAAQADAKKLSGAARTSFTKKCEADATASMTCEDKASAKKLAGAAKTSFVKKCDSDAKAAGAAATCESQAMNKKLAGAAKNSFVKKCVADAKA